MWMYAEIIIFLFINNWFVLMIYNGVFGYLKNQALGYYCLFIICLDSVYAFENISGITPH